MPPQTPSKGFAVFVCVLVLILLAIGFMVGKRCVRQYLIESRGIVADGTAFSIGYKHSLNGRTSGYFVTYTFDYNGVTYTGTSGANSSWACSASMPASVRVRFVPSDPNLSWPLEVGVYNPLWVGILFTLLPLSMATYLVTKTILYLRTRSKI